MSVLKEANPKSLEDLYNSDPLDLTNDDIDNLIEDWRRKRHLWEREEKSAQAEGRKRKPKAYRDAPDSSKLTISSLGLGKPTGDV